MNPKKIKIILFFLLTCTLIFFFHRGIFPGFVFKNNKSSDFNLFQTTIQLIQKDYVDEPDPQKAMGGAYQGLVDSLDVLSSYLSQASLQRLSLLKSDPIFDSGLIVYKRYGSFPLVIGIKDDSPAMEAGLKTGDLLTSINGQPTVRWSMTETNLALKDKKAQSVELDVLRQNTKLKFNLTLKRRENPPLKLSPLNKKTNNLQIRHFYSPVSQIFEQEILPGLSHSTKPLVIDLRNCSEGENSEAIKILDNFIQVNQVGFFQKKNQPFQYVSCPSPVKIPDIPLIIWTNQATIGPAELLAASLQKYRNALVVGTKTPGLVGQQRLFPFDDGTALLLTTAVFQFSKEEKFWLTGLHPTIELDPQERTPQDYIQATLRLINQNNDNPGP